LPGPEEVELARINYLREAHRWETGCGVVRTLFRCVVGIAIAVCTFKAVASIAGEVTVFRAAIDAGLRIGADRWIAYLFGGVGVGGYAVERRNKQRAVEGMKKEMDALRDAVNKKRGRSGLSPRGKPSKRDLTND
jgi:hypothetical protein